MLRTERAKSKVPFDGGATGDIRSRVGVIRRGISEPDQIGRDCLSRRGVAGARYDGATKVDLVVLSSTGDRSEPLCNAMMTGIG